jgi:hypothetical protein
MTDLISLAKQAGASTYTNRYYPYRTFNNFSPKKLQAFADLIRQDEREACAKVCESLGMSTNGLSERNHDCAAAIRARTT